MVDLFKDLVSKCDELIKQGKMGEISVLLSKVNFSQIPRIHRAPLAKICRRTGLIGKGLQILHPLIRSERELDVPATDLEISEYAVLLSRNGSIREALDLLGKIDSSQLPESLLYQGFCNVSQWDYLAAAPFFENFIGRTKDEYSKLIASVNLASCYLDFGKHNSTLEFINQTLELAEKLNAQRLKGNLLEIRTQEYIRAGDLSAAEKDLNLALAVFANEKTYDQLLSLKWKSFIHARKENSLTPIQEFRQEAWSRRHWESVREADLFKLQMQFNQKDFDYLSIGTAAPAYRRRLQQLLEHIPSSNITIGNPNSSFRLDLETGFMSISEELNLGKKIHQSLLVLTQDFYSPLNIGHLFSELYPGEYFNVESSPVRVHQVVKRLRRWMEDSKIPVKVEYDESGYRLSVQGDFALVIPSVRPVCDSKAFEWQKLCAQIGFDKNFDINKATEVLSISKSGFHRLAEWAFEEGKLEIYGVGKATRYKILRPHKKAA